MTAEAFAAACNVSRETLSRCETYLALLRRWQPHLNLVGPSTLSDPWRRHFLDSAQLLPLMPEGTRVVLDVGSGAGFPGLVLAILGVPEVHLVEADQRKVVFLREAARHTNTTVTVHARRLETLDPFPVDVVTARALAPLPRLLDWTAPFLEKGAEALFLKGEAVEEELTESGSAWMMRVDRFPSRTGSSGFVLRLGEVRRV
ncbi:16S rRNA (guanine(527)-N(7))-methyltransferase RsmG [Pararhodospirillum oryzae]|uniref:16S rRNA (guanine(527)-N(7))-methyltransferase RsmG n=1 Tax=Pararhodospirillum oryzae TaxID=478448 RepID=UPI0014794AAF|nr:16S rRNA (guanine(527)-N(7))-methyltransferase RsmG [Pararhodospirillum oryzae]